MTANTEAVNRYIKVDSLINVTPTFELNQVIAPLLRNARSHTVLCSQHDETLSTPIPSKHSSPTDYSVITVEIAKCIFSSVFTMITTLLIDDISP